MLGDYLDFQLFMQSQGYRRSQSFTMGETKDRTTSRNVRRRRFFDPNVYQVRPSICVAGFNKRAIERVKNTLASLTEEPLPLESFHVVRKTDVKDGALLVPKIVLVAVHCPGKKLIDCEGDEGQLDYLYDEAINLGAEILVIYLDLPKVIYPPARNYIYHPRITDLLFPSQRILESLAMESELVTVTENSDFNSIQKNLLREWIRRPVPGSHRIFRSAQYLSEISLSEAEWWSENEAARGAGHVNRGADDRRWSGGFASASESAETVRPKGKTSRKKNRRSYGTVRMGNDQRRPLLWSSSTEDPYTQEMDLYNETSSYHSDSMRLTEQV